MVVSKVSCHSPEFVKFPRLHSQPAARAESAGRDFRSVSDSAAAGWDSAGWCSVAAMWFACRFAVGSSASAFDWATAPSPSESTAMATHKTLPAAPSSFPLPSSVWSRRAARCRWGSRTGRIWKWPWRCRSAGGSAVCCLLCAATPAASARGWRFRSPSRTAAAPRRRSFSRPRRASWSSWCGPAAAVGYLKERNWWEPDPLGSVAQLTRLNHFYLLDVFDDFGEEVLQLLLRLGELLVLRRRWVHAESGRDEEQTVINAPSKATEFVIIKQINSLDINKPWK